MRLLGTDFAFKGFTFQINRLPKNLLQRKKGERSCHLGRMFSMLTVTFVQSIDWKLANSVIVAFWKSSQRQVSERSGLIFKWSLLRAFGIMEAWGNAEALHVLCFGSLSEYSWCSVRLWAPWACPGVGRPLLTGVKIACATSQDVIKRLHVLFIQSSKFTFLIRMWMWGFNTGPLHG